MTSSPPPHWDNRRLKSLARIVNGGTPSSTVPEYWDGNIIWLTPDDLGKLNTAYVKTGARSITQEGYNSCSTTLAPAGSIVVSTRAPIGHTAILEADACVNQGCRILVPDKTIQTRYLYRSLTALKHELETRGKGTTFAELSHGDLGTVPILVPPPSEQASIVHYLDHADELINRYISAKERLITLMEEQRQAVIHHAVTLGLDPNVPVRESDLPGLGYIPKHWAVRRLGHLATKFGSGITPRGGATVYREDGIPFLRSQNVHFGGLHLQGVARIPLALHRELSASHVQPNDVLLNITGASIGRVCTVPNDFVDANVNQHVCIIRPHQRHLLPLYLSAYLSTPHMQSEIRTEQTGASREGLTLQSIRDFLLPVPPVPEQRSIIDAIDERTKLIRQAASISKDQIRLMNEYRTRLIADVVTGQLDVRSADVNASEIPAAHS